MPRAFQHTTLEVIALWLAHLRFCGRRYLASHEIETVLPEWAQTEHRVLATPGTWSRKFRQFRKTMNPSDIGFRLVDASNEFKGRSEKTWRIEKIEDTVRLPVDSSPIAV